MVAFLPSDSIFDLVAVFELSLYYESAHGHERQEGWNYLNENDV